MSQVDTYKGIVEAQLVKIVRPLSNSNINASESMLIIEDENPTEPRLCGFHSITRTSALEHRDRIIPRLQPGTGRTGCAERKRSCLASADEVGQ
jgi:hypothetical protein